MRSKKISYYFGMGIAYGALFGGLFSVTFADHMLIMFFGPNRCLVLHSENGLGQIFYYFLKIC